MTFNCLLLDGLGKGSDVVPVLTLFLNIISFAGAQEPVDYKRTHVIPYEKKFRDESIGVAFQWRPNFDVDEIFWTAPKGERKPAIK